MTVSVTVEECKTVGRPGLCVRCDKCGHKVKVRGRTDSAALRGTVVLRESCPGREGNYYLIREDRQSRVEQPQEIARG